MASAELQPSKTGKLLYLDPKEPLIIGLDTKDGPEHELWDERINLPLEETMVVNIMDIGVKESITLRKSMAQDGKYEVVDGRGRIMHAREANKRLKKAGDPLVMVPCLLENGDETHMQRVAIALNEIRRDDNTMVKAEKCVRLLQRNGGDVKQAAATFGVSVVAIKNWVKAAELSSKVKKAIASGAISASAAVEACHGLEKEQQVAKLEKLTSHAKANGKKRATTASAKREAGKRTAVPRRVLLKLIDDEDLSAKIEPEVAHGIRLALGLHVPGETTRLGKLLAQAGYQY